MDAVAVATIWTMLQRQAFELRELVPETHQLSLEDLVLAGFVAVHLLQMIIMGLLFGATFRSRDPVLLAVVRLTLTAVLCHLIIRTIALAFGPRLLALGVALVRRIASAFLALDSVRLARVLTLALLVGGRIGVWRRNLTEKLRHAIRAIVDDFALRGGRQSWLSGACLLKLTGPVALRESARPLRRGQTT